jgi:hypothetical protein
MAAQKLGLATVPCVEVKHLTEAQRKAYILADNKLALNAGWNDELLRMELAELNELDFDITLTGFSLDEMACVFDEITDEKKAVYKAVFNLIVVLENEEQQEKLFNRLQSEGYECQPQSF